MAGHCRSAELVKMCLRNGGEIIYHATLLDEEASDMLEAARDRIFVAPTLGIQYSTLYDAAPGALPRKSPLIRACAGNSIAASSRCRNSDGVA